MVPMRTSAPMPMTELADSSNKTIDTKGKTAFIGCLTNRYGPWVTSLLFGCSPIVPR